MVPMSLYAMQSRERDSECDILDWGGARTMSSTKITTRVYMNRRVLKPKDLVLVEGMFSSWIVIVLIIDCKCRIKCIKGIGYNGAGWFVMGTGVLILLESSSRSTSTELTTKTNLA